jgi:hypothetical protein
MPAGQYELFGDLVHATGVSETVTGVFTTGAINGAPLAGDGSAWSEPKVRLKADATYCQGRHRLKADATYYQHVA